MKFTDLTLRNKLMLAVLPIVVIAVAILSVASYNTARKNILEIQYAGMTKLVESTVDELELWMKGREDVAALLADQKLFKAACRGEQTEEAQALLNKYHQAWPLYENLFLAEPGGQLFLIAQGDPTGINISQIPAYAANVQKARNGQVWMSSVGLSPVSGRPVTLLTAPIYDNNELIGIVGTPIELNAFSETFISPKIIGKTGYVYMIDATGLVLAHPTTENIMKTNLADNQFGKDMVAQKNGTIEYIWEGKDKVTVFEEDKARGWIVAGTEFKEVFVAPIHSMAVTGWLLGLAAVGLITLVLWLISGAVAKVMNNVADTLEDIAEGEGDLTKRIGIDQHDEIGRLARLFDQFLDKLNDLIKQVKLNTEEVATASNEISATAAEMAAGAEEQSSQTSEVAAGVQEMSAAIHENSQNAGETAGIATEAGHKAQEGAAAMEQTRKGMINIVESAAKTGEIVQSLAGRAEQIDEIIQVIDDIADQTNLLALNAAIEAARAGEQGRGFAVVADEVRKLAERTTKATGEIASTIQAIQSDTKDAAESMNVARGVVEEGQASIDKTASMLDEINHEVQKAMDMVQQIAAASEEQSQSAEQISQNVEGISTVAHQSAGGAEELAATAEQLNQQTEALRRLVAQFKVN